jgi:drug/metabolite transporter (DMT)-like permease
VRQTARWCGFFDASATICYALAVHPGALGIVATLISLYPATTIVLARVVLHERLRRRQMVGLAFAAGAVLLITSG